LEETNELGEVSDTLEMRVELSFCRDLVTSAWLAKEIFGEAEDFGNI
jgi:hypothetical protein